MTNRAQIAAWKVGDEPEQLEDWADGFVRPFTRRDVDHRQNVAPFTQKSGSFDRYAAIDTSILPEGYPTEF